MRAGVWLSLLSAFQAWGSVDAFAWRGRLCVRMAASAAAAGTVDDAAMLARQAQTEADLKTVKDYLNRKHKELCVKWLLGFSSLGPVSASRTRSLLS
jgi:hypothetical protein